MSFLALQRRAYEMLREDGFDDIEAGAPDGCFADRPLKENIPASEFRPDELDHEARAGHVRVAVELAAQDAGAAALHDPLVWAGLPRRARRIWALVVVVGWEVGTAARHCRVPHQRAYEWVATVRSRVAAR